MSICTLYLRSRVSDSRCEADPLNTDKFQLFRWLSLNIQAKLDCLPDSRHQRVQGRGA